ncbi:hypothetical protein L596_021522 [Steinernema carpocapsae]|uniref:G-protein coupled receptors family 1 profile domain-containing protein n=1 Tax=Steinernema carpocapsae TaxID=34508 RepID=A0A4U5MJ20_STECR|nr:hypothetical protein L596_021522 [Steinernema carpocapsae]
MPDDYELLYNRVLDVTACIHIPVKLFTMTVIILSTTPDQFHYNMLMLSVMFWNFAANTLSAFVHLYPSWPAECYRLGGPLSNFIDNEKFAHFMFSAIFVCVLNTGLSLNSIFPYRYFIFVHPNLVKKVKPKNVYITGALSFAVLDFILVWTISMWSVPYDEYPEPSELPERTLLFCFQPAGFWKYAALLNIFITYFSLLILVILCSALLLKAFNSHNSYANKQTIEIQRKVFWTLVVLTSIVIIFAAVPFAIAMFTTMFPHLPYAQPVCLVCIIFVTNHGAVYAIATITFIGKWQSKYLKKRYFCCLDGRGSQPVRLPCLL